MIYHQETGQRVVEHLSSDPNVGLRHAQVEERRGKFGENRLREARKKTMSLLSNLLYMCYDSICQIRNPMRYNSTIQTVGFYSYKR